MLYCHSFNYDLQFAIRKVQVNQNGLKLNGTHQLIVYADDVNTFDGSLHSIKKRKKIKKKHRS